MKNKKINKILDFLIKLKRKNKKQVNERAIVSSV